MAGRWVVGGLALLASASVHAESLTDRLGSRLPREISALPGAIAGAVGRSIPVLSVSPGVRFDYDPEAGAYTRRVVTGGQVQVEHAETLGTGHWNVNASYEYLQFDRLGGQPLRDLTEPRPFVDEQGNRLFALRKLDIDVAVQQAALDLTYGIAQDVDVQLVLPLAHADLVRREHFQFFGIGPESSGTSGDATGIGDVYVRGKVGLVHGDALAVSAGLGIRAPSGAADDFLGGGLTEVVPALYLSSRPWEVQPGVSVRFASNLAMAFAAEDVERSQGRWSLGVDASFYEGLHGAIALLGAHDVGATLDESAIEALLCESGCRGSSPRVVESPLFGLDAGRADMLAFSAGLRVVLWQDTVIAFANVTVPLLDQGVVTEPVPLVGVEIGL